MRRRVFAVLGVVAVLGAAGWFAAPALRRVQAPIRVGLVHSLAGPMAISESAMVKAEQMAIEELNEQGGLLGRRVEGVVGDGKSDPSTFTREAERLIRAEKVSVLVGCWTSACRKGVKGVVEREGHLLIYPVAYEGLEQSPNIVYTGAAANQQALPTVTWARDVLKAKSFFLVGTDAVWPRALGEVVKDQITALGATLAGAEFVTAGSADVEAVVGKALAAHPDVILTALEGDDNVPFYHAMRGAGRAEALKVPVLSFSVAEDELRTLPAKAMTNDYVVCNYFQSLERPVNVDFVRRFKARFGAESVTSDAVATAYTSVMLWGQAVREAATDDPRVVQGFLLKQSRDAPEGVIAVDRATRHTWRPFFVGRVLGDGQIEVLTSLQKTIRPTPFPLSRSRQAWDAYLDSLRSRWGGAWEPPAARTAAGAPL